jgi:hypothetical protein
MGDEAGREASGLSAMSPHHRAQHAEVGKAQWRALGGSCGLAIDGEVRAGLGAGEHPRMIDAN